MAKMHGPGKQLPDGTIVKREKSGGLNSMRCIRCKRGQAVQVRKPDGRVVYRCSACGAEYAPQGMR